jgi:hypothetical protein
VEFTRDKATWLSCIGDTKENLFQWSAVKNSCCVFSVCKLGKFELSVFFQVLKPKKPA